MLNEQLRTEVMNLEYRVQQLEIALAELLASQEQLMMQNDMSNIGRDMFRVTEAIVKAKRLLHD